MKIRCVKDINQYWERLSVSLSYFNRFLQRKAEYGSNVSEKGIQGSVLFTAKEIARERNMNEHLVSSLCQAVAYCFPERGLAELNVIKDFIKKNNIDVALDRVEIEAIEYAIYESGAVVTPELDDMLSKYYSNDESAPEVNLVRFLQKYLNLNRNLLCECSFSSSGKVIDEIMKRAKMEYELSYRLLPDVIIQPVPEKVKAEIEGTLLTFIEYNKDEYVGIYEAIMY